MKYYRFDDTVVGFIMKIPISRNRGLRSSSSIGERGYNLT
jgi:hypothetical protein